MSEWGEIQRANDDDTQNFSHTEILNFCIQSRAYIKVSTDHIRLNTWPSNYLFTP